MAIVNSVATYSGEGYQLLQNIAFPISAANLTCRVPASTAAINAFSPAVARGLFRCKIYNGGGTSPTFNTLTVTAQDGTNTVFIDEVGPNVAVTLSSTSYADVMGDFIVDTAVASNGGSAGTMIFGGATFFNFLFTMGGTSYTALADAEVAAAP